ncbi:MAG: hypothetical protein ACI9OJ_005964 [Myxococcota bacterium]
MIARRHAATCSVVAIGLAVLAFAGCKKDSKPVPQVPVEPIDGTSSLTSPGEGGDPLPGTTAEPQDGPVMEVEPNSDRMTATALPINGAIRGSLTRPEAGGAKDQDWFVLNLPAGNSQQVRLQLSPEDDSDYVLSWMPEVEPAKSKRRKRKRKSTALGRVDNAGKGGVEVLPPMVLAPGRHFFRVSVAKKRKKRRRRGPKAEIPFERPYRLSSTVVEPDPRVEQEPNQTRDTASVLRTAEPREGYLGWSQDSDWYRLDLGDAPEGSFLRVDVTGVPDVKSRLWLTDKSGKSLVKAPEPKVHWSAGRAVTIRDISIKADRQPYYVEVRATRSASPHERYTIKATVDESSDSREREPNWRPQNSTPLTVETPMDGFMAHPTDWDTFRLDAQDPMVATVVVTGVEGVDLRLEHIDSSHKSVVKVNEGGVGAPETLPLVGVGPQPSYVRVTSKDHTFNVDTPYRISVTMVDARGQELEPNDRVEDAGRVTLRIGEPIKALVHPRGDLDYFALDASSMSPGDKRVYKLSLTGVDGMTLAMHIYDRDKALITRKTSIGGGETKTITHGFSPGRYFVSVRADAPDSASADEKYTLELSE